jgi:hypothetical protein
MNWEAMKAGTQATDAERPSSSALAHRFSGMCDALNLIGRKLGLPREQGRINKAEGKDVSFTVALNRATRL